MRAAQEMILCGVDEVKCLECRSGYERSGLNPDCLMKNRCVYTGEAKTRLNYIEKIRMDETMDFLATETIVSTDFEHRQSIIRLASYIKSLMRQKDEICQSAKK